MRDAWRTLAAIATVVAFTGPAACGEVSRDSGGGQARDSAGTRVIELPEPEETPERVLALDTTWSARPALELGDLSDVDVTPNGGVLLLDRLAAQVIRLDAEGAVTARFGRAGAGPGEFDPRGLSVLVVTDSSVLVPDLFQQRVTELSLVLATSSEPGRTRSPAATRWTGGDTPKGDWRIGSSPSPATASCAGMEPSWTRS